MLVQHALLPCKQGAADLVAPRIPPGQGKGDSNKIKYELTNKKYIAFYIKVKKTKELSQVREKFFKTNYIKQNLKYNPHISLYYGEKDIITKKRIISKLPKLNKSVTIDKISIVDVNEKINKWKIIKRIKLSEEKN